MFVASRTSKDQDLRFPKPDPSRIEALATTALARASRKRSPSQAIETGEFKTPLQTVPTHDSTPKVSLIICTRNRAADLEGCLASVAAAARGRNDVEVIVVDNGSRDATPAVVQSWAKNTGFAVLALKEPVAGVSRAKNRALKAARGDIVAFTDDDCRLAPDYFDRLNEAHDHYAAPCLIGGRVELGGDDALPFTIKTDMEPEVLVGDTHPGGFAHGCNLSFSRSLFDRIGGFDVRLGPGAPISAAEDTDMVIRAKLAGASVVYVPDFVVFHHHGRNRNAQVKALHRSYNSGNGALYLKYAFRYPSLLRHLYWDMRNGLRERFGGPLFNEALGLTHWGKVSGNLAGALQMLCLMLGIGGFEPPP